MELTATLILNLALLIVPPVALVLVFRQWLARHIRWTVALTALCDVLLFWDELFYSYSDKELSAFRRKRIGFIFQQFNLLPVLTAKENIIMPLLLDKQKPDEAYLKQLTELLGIQGRLEHLPHELSGGQQQRVAIARALIAKPDVIFADEPTGNLDSKSGGEVMELLQNVWKKMGKALVVITHDSRIARMAERQFQIVDGVLTEVTAK